MLYCLLIRVLEVRLQASGYNNKRFGLRPETRLRQGLKSDIRMYSMYCTLRTRKTLMQTFGPERDWLMKYMIMIRSIRQMDGLGN
jgi:hypothetical protein